MSARHGAASAASADIPKKETILNFQSPTRSVLRPTPDHVLVSAPPSCNLALDRRRILLRQFARRFGRNWNPADQFAQASAMAPPRIPLLLCLSALVAAQLAPSPDPSPSSGADFSADLPTIRLSVLSFLQRHAPSATCSPFEAMEALRNVLNRYAQSLTPSSGKCSGAGVLIPVNTAADIDLRLQYSPTTLVQLELRATSPPRSG